MAELTPKQIDISPVDLKHAAWQKSVEDYLQALRNYGIADKLASEARNASSHYGQGSSRGHKTFKKADEDYREMCKYYIENDYDLTDFEIWNY